jgi:hypothetical protein
MRLLRVYLLAFGALAALVIPAAASARSVSPDAGTITLKPSAVARGRMEGVNISLSGKRMRVSGGLWSFDRLADDGGGSLRTRGVLRFRRGRLKVDIHDLQITLARASGSGRYIDGRVSGRIVKVRYPLGVLVTRTYRSSAGRFDNLDFLLSPAVAGNVNRALQSPGLRAGETFATLVGRNISKKLSFDGGQARVSLSDPIVSAFATAGASVTPLPGTQGDGRVANPFRLPIGGGALDLVSLRGAIELGGGIRMSPPPGRTFGGLPVIDTGPMRIAAVEEGYVLSASSGLQLFSVIEDADTRFDRTTTAYKHIGLALQFTYPAAQLIAPALDMTPTQLLSLPKGQLDVDAHVAR